MVAGCGYLWCNSAGLYEPGLGRAGDVQGMVLTGCCLSVSQPAEEVTAEGAQEQLRASRRGKLPLVDREGRLVGLATRTLFRDDARMPFGGEQGRGVEGKSHVSICCFYKTCCFYKRWAHAVRTLGG